MKLKAEDWVFFIVIALMILIALWLLSGSPPIDNAIITLFIYVVTSDLLLWRKVYSIDKNTTIGFMKVKNDFNKINNRLDNIDTKLNNIEKLIKRR